MVEGSAALSEAELRLRIRQLEAGETRTLLIIRALTCFYTALAGFVASTLVSLMGGVLVSARIGQGVGDQQKLLTAEVAGKKPQRARRKEDWHGSG